MILPFADCVLKDARLTLTQGGAPLAVWTRAFNPILLLVRNAVNSPPATA